MKHTTRKQVKSPTQNLGFNIWMKQARCFRTRPLVGVSLTESWSLAFTYFSNNASSFLTILQHIYDDRYITINTISIQGRTNYIVLIGGEWVSFFKAHL